MAAQGFNTHRIGVEVDCAQVSVGANIGSVAGWGAAHGGARRADWRQRARGAVVEGGTQVRLTQTWTQHTVTRRIGADLTSRSRSKLTSGVGAGRGRAHHGDGGGGRAHGVRRFHNHVGLGAGGLPSLLAPAERGRLGRLGLVALRALGRGALSGGALRGGPRQRRGSLNNKRTRIRS